MQTFTKAQFWAELEQLDEETVRERIIGKVYGSGNHKLELAEEWLRMREQQRTDEAAKKTYDLNVESLKAARSAKNAAWVAAAFSVMAVIVSIVALILSRQTK